MKKKQVLPEALHVPPTLPVEPTPPSISKLKWSNFAHCAPCSKDKFKSLSKEGRAPKGEILSPKIILYDNQEVRRWLADPVGYKVTKED